MKVWMVLVAVAGFVVATGSTSADVMFYEGFENQTLWNAPAGWTSHSNSNQRVVPGPQYPDYDQASYAGNQCVEHHPRAYAAGDRTQPLFVPTDRPWTLGFAMCLGSNTTINVDPAGCGVDYWGTDYESESVGGWFKRTKWTSGDSTFYIKVGSLDTDLPVAFDRWYYFQAEVDPVAGSADWYVDYNTEGLMELVGSDVPLVENTNSTYEHTIRFGGGSLSAGDMYAYFDEISITPEPSCLGLLALGGLALIRRR